MFTGKLSPHEMAHEHGAELDVIETGAERPHEPVSTAGSGEGRRRRIFIPIAVLAGLVSLIGLYFFASYESTAIETVPPAETMQAYVRATVTPTYPPTRTPTPTITSTLPSASTGGPTEEAVAVEAPQGEVVGPLVPQITHPLKGRDDCLMCHGTGKPVAFPENHLHYQVANCTLCHCTEAPMPAPKPVVHSIENRDECTQCHQPPDLVPATHLEAGFDSRSCPICHEPMERGWLAIYEPLPITRLVWQKIRPRWVRFRMPQGSVRVIQPRALGRGCPPAFICQSCRFTCFSYDEKDAT